jgi:integrase/recombinase XerD
VSYSGEYAMTADLLLSQVIDGFLLARTADGYSLSTIDQYKWGLHYFLLSTGDIPLSQVSKTHIRELLAALQSSTLSSTSIYHVWKAIRALYKWASIELKIDRPDLDIKAPPHIYAEIVPFTHDEIRLLLKTLERTSPSVGKRESFTMARPTASRDRAIILTLLDTGIRASELSRLKMTDIDLTTGVLQVKPFQSGKKSKPRTIPIGTIARKALWRYYANREKCEYAFCTDELRPIDRTVLLHLLGRLGERAGVVDVHPHRFRHTFAITFLRNGGDVFTLQRLLGHASLEMVRHYLALAQADDEAAHRRASPVDCWRL